MHIAHSSFRGGPSIKPSIKKLLDMSKKGPEKQLVMKLSGGNLSGGKQALIKVCVLSAEKSNRCVWEFVDKCSL